MQTVYEVTFKYVNTQGYDIQYMTEFTLRTYNGVGDVVFAKQGITTKGVC